jgi:hypothetical protein
MHRKDQNTSASFLDRKHRSSGFLLRPEFSLNFGESEGFKRLKVPDARNK